jgi:hypothetical protein
MKRRRPTLHLSQVADEAVLARPSKVRAIAEARIKTGKIDSEIARKLAQLAWTVWTERRC